MAAIALEGLALFGAGNLVYFGATDLISEIGRHASPGQTLLHFVILVFGLTLMPLLALGGA